MDGVQIRTLCHSGELRYSQEGHPFLITRKAIQDCIVLLEAKTKAKREAKLAKKLVKESNANGTLAAASERGKQAAIELKKLISNG